MLGFEVYLRRQRWGWANQATGGVEGSGNDVGLLQLRLGGVVHG